MTKSIAPLLAVREALGLSLEDAEEILGPSVDPVAIDNGCCPQLAGLYSLLDPDGSEGGQVELRISNPDGTTFKSWIVTRDGMLLEPADDNGESE